jgi:threonine dehydrogenase-like Zn-dependent dehydrogenase
MIEIFRQLLNESTDYVVGRVYEVGEGVTRFKKGDRVLSMSALALRNDHRFGAHQRYTLSVEALTAHVCSLQPIGHQESLLMSRSRFITLLSKMQPLQQLFMLPCPLLSYT